MFFGHFQLMYLNEELNDLHIHISHPASLAVKKNAEKYAINKKKNRYISEDTSFYNETKLIYNITIKHDGSVEEIFMIFFHCNHHLKNFQNTLVKRKNQFFKSDIFETIT